MHGISGNNNDTGANAKCDTSIKGTPMNRNNNEKQLLANDAMHMHSVMNNIGSIQQLQTQTIENANYNHHDNNSVVSGGSCKSKNNVKPENQDADMMMIEDNDK